MEIELPDGTVLDAPDDADPSQVAKAYLAKQGTARTSLKSQNPAEYDPNSSEYQAKYGPAAVPWGENFTAGVGKSFTDLGQGVRQLYANAADVIAPRNKSLSDLVIGGDPSRSAAIQREVDQTAARDAPLMRSGGGVTGYVSGNVAQFALPGSMITRAATLPGRLGQAAVVGGALANLQPVQSGQSRALNTTIGGAGGVAGELLASGLGALARGRSAKVSPEVQALAQKADELGIPLRAEQVSGSRPMAGISAALDTIPFSGRDASREIQRKAFLSAIANTMGENTDNLATAVKQGEQRLGAAYDSVLRTNPVKVDQTMVSELDSVLQGARSELSDAQFGVIQRQVDNLLSKVQVGDQIDGQAAYNIKKTLDRISRGSDSSVAYHARELKDTLLSALDRSLPEDVAQQFATVREQYGNLITVRKLIRAGADGNITPARLANAQTRGALRDVANVGAQFLKEPFGNSGTANRQIGAGIIGALGGGAFFDPTLAASAALGGATVGRATNALLQSPAFVRYQLQGSNALLGVTPYANTLLPALGAAGAIASQ